MIDPNKNCHSYCPYGKLCRYAKGENGQDPDDCGTFYKLDDLNNEAKEIEMEERRAIAEEGDEWW